MPTPLNLSPTNKPFKSSHLAIPPSPFSPRLPLTPFPTHPSAPSKPLLSALTFPPPPPQPLHWLWQCHLCNRVYRLGTTRRCLDDGHHFCAGTTTVKRSRKSGRKVVRHKACASEFDYAGWKAWGVWRRGCRVQRAAAEELERFLEVDGMGDVAGQQPCDGTATGEEKDCWGECDYPSECRWGKQYGVAAPTATPEVTVTAPLLPASSDDDMIEAEDSPAGTTFEDILLDISSIADEDLLADLTHSVCTEEEHPHSPASTPTPTSPVDEKKPSMTDLLESAKRRKRRSAGAATSPLALTPPSPDFQGASDKFAAEGSFQRAIDDFEVDMRKSFGRRAGEVVGQLFGRREAGNGSANEGRGRKKSSAGNTW
ncbi:uncharacterized protein LTR77_006216 [Saxophila tyrrhenica]|uniref:Uncharacterized protein n=1 Tax=Saxophila tyrrhenica TaxID=1690608 RepID=A0AAV9PAA8_9PEZI|nr:hypothetical protein LTR77_006216 [Saxophila tyrrhenica]